MARIGRPLFRRGLKYVAIRRIRMTATHFIEPGERVDLPTYRLRALYNRRRIGPEGHPWTEQCLRHSEGYPKPWVTDTLTDAPAASEKPIEPTPQIEPVKIGSYWLLPGLTEEKFRSRKKAAAFLDAHKTATAGPQSDGPVRDEENEDDKRS